MIPDVHATLLAPPGYRPGRMLICGSLPPGMVSTAALGENALWLHMGELEPLTGGLEPLATTRLPHVIPAVLAAGHGTWCLALLDLVAGLDFDHLWFVHHDVHLAGAWPAFLESFGDSEADFLAPLLRSRSDDPDWNWWGSLVPPEGEAMPPEDRQSASLSTVFRISRTGLGVVRSALERGWLGHFEALLPTAIVMADLTVEDLGNRGSFTPAHRAGLHYDDRTFGFTFPGTHVPGFLHHPVPPPTSPPAPHRFSPPPPRKPRVLYFSPVGPGAADLLPATLDRFSEASAEVLLVEYAASGIAATGDVTLVPDRGQKWELARRHLDPSRIDEFDFVFVWDDDIGIGDFDVTRFLRIMEANRLDMAQPSLVSPHPICHGITCQRSCPPPLGNLARVGRLTNFVEIMVPVFTRESWASLFSYLTPATRTGWGLDALPLGRKGIVDCMHVVHTRPCNDHGPEAYAEMGRLLNSNGLFELRHHDLGHLLEKPDTPPAGT